MGARVRALGLAAGLVGWSFLTPRIPLRWRVPTQAVAGALLAARARDRVGLAPPRLWAGLRVGVPMAAGVAGVIAGAAALPPVAATLATRAAPASRRGRLRWLVWGIPVGTVWAEEAAFRAALAGAAGAAFQPRAARLVQAVTFGLWHVVDARAGGGPAWPTVLATGTAGWVFHRLAQHTGSLAAPMCVHLAINEAGALAVLAARRRAAGSATR